MISNLSVSKKIQIPLIISILFGIALALVNVYMSKASVENKAFQSVSNELALSVGNQLDAKMSIGLTNAINIASNINVVNSLKTGNRQNAIGELDNLLKIYKEYT